jgi:tRNA(Ile2)-agmatinylcytidine synthase
MDRLTTPRTFNNYDYENKRMLITPHGPDPVLLGIRGETAEIVKKAFFTVKIREAIERWVVFRTNHGTDAHLRNGPVKNQIKPDRPAALSGIVSDPPRRISGGHVFFTLSHQSGIWDCAAFEPTGRFREIVAGLLPGDEVTVYGGVKKREANPFLTINLEKVRIHQLVEMFELENPTCPHCRKHMKSAGRGQGFRCEKCSITSPKSSRRTVRKLRAIGPGLYVPALKAHRHLTKPLSRYGQEKTWDQSPPFGRWHDP